MPLTSVFYDGPVTETDRAKNRAGAPDYGVYGPDDFNVSTHPSIPYALTVKAGKAHGHGVTDTAATDQMVQCATLSGTGAVRYDLIVVRRNWQPLLGGPSTLAAIQGGSTVPNINNLRLKTPGVEDDQPIALVKWQGNQNTPAQIIDLRCWPGNGGMIAADLLALDYLARPGADVLIGNTTYRFALGANNVWGWVGDSTLSMYGVGQALSGLPPTGAKFLVQAGTIVLKTDPQGYSGFNWPKEFPNGLLTLDLRSGDEFANGIGTTITPTGGTFWGTQGAGDKKGIIYSVASSAGVRRGNLTHRVNYTAIGW